MVLILGWILWPCHFCRSEIVGYWQFPMVLPGVLWRGHVALCFRIGTWDLYALCWAGIFTLALICMWHWTGHPLPLADIDCSENGVIVVPHHRVVFKIKYVHVCKGPRTGPGTRLTLCVVFFMTSSFLGPSQFLPYLCATCVVIVLVSTGCYNTVPGTAWLNRHLFLIVLHVGSLRSECQHGQLLVRAPFLACQCPLPHVFTR